MMTSSSSTSSSTSSSSSASYPATSAYLYPHNIACLNRIKTATSKKKPAGSGSGRSAVQKNKKGTKDQRLLVAEMALHVLFNICEEKGIENTVSEELENLVFGSDMLSRTGVRFRPDVHIGAMGQIEWFVHAGEVPEE